ncbi:MAG: HEAT repeat domain-containing protein [Planctomycetota bacterium]|nr:HEAT repeat domain-containing protein [Planctomycetota bacterium]
MQAWVTRGRALAVGLLIAATLVGCTRTKKLSGEDTTIFEDLRYGVLGQDRPAEEYYRIVRERRDDRTGRYRVTQDKYLVDKTVDAVQRLGKLEYERLESQAQVMDLLGDVVASDPSALARTNAANSLTRLAVRLQQPDVRLVRDDGRGMRALVRQMDALHGGARASRDPARTARLLDQLGRYELPTGALAREALRPLYTRRYLVESGGAVRRALDQALVLRMREAARLSLEQAVDADTGYLREEAVRGLKTIQAKRSEPVVLRRLGREPEARVRAEIVEYLGVAGSSTSIAALLPLLDDANPTLRVKARQSLTRIAGRDLGFRRATWTRWAIARHPELAAPADGPSQPTPGMR